MPGDKKKKKSTLLSKALDLLIKKPEVKDSRSGNVNQNKQLKKLDRK